MQNVEYISRFVFQHRMRFDEFPEGLPSHIEDKCLSAIQNTSVELLVRLLQK